MPLFRSAWRRHLLALGLYSLLAVLLTWPLSLHLTTHVPGVPQWAFDESTFVWNIWQFKHALIDNLQSPLHSELIWFPLGIDLILYTYNFYHVLAAMPLALAVNLPFASNVTLLSSTVLSGYGTWLLVSYLLMRLSDWEIERLGDSPADRLGAPIPQSLNRLISQSPNLPIFWSAFAAGAVYAFASNRAVYAALGHYDMVTTQWIPFYALALLRILDPQLAPARQRRWAILGGVFFALTGLAEMISALFLAMFTVIVLLVRFRDWRVESKRVSDWENKRLSDAGQTSSDAANTQSPNLPISQSPISNLLLLAVTAFLVWSPALIPIVREFFTADYDLQGWGDALMLSTDLLGWFTATVFHPIFGGDVVAEMRLVQQRAANPDLTGFRDLNTVFLGWATLALAVVGSIAFWRKVRVWVWTSLVFGVLTLGPLLQINGRYRFDLDGLETTVPLPFALLHFIPVIKANRAPNRNSVLLMLGLAVLAAMASTGCWAGCGAIGRPGAPAG